MMNCRFVRNTIAVLCAVATWLLLAPIAKAQVTVSSIVGYPGGTSITASTDGVYVDVYGNIFVIDTGGARAVEIPANGGPAIVIATSLATARGIAADVSGNIYVGQNSALTVTKYPYGGGAATTIGTIGGRQFEIAVDNAIPANLYVTDQNGAKVDKVNTSSNTTTTAFADTNSVKGVALDPAGNLYVTNAINPGSITELPAGSTTTVTLALQGLNLPYGIGFDQAGNLYVTNEGSPYSLLEYPVGFTTSTTPIILAATTSTVQGVSVNTRGDIIYNNGGARVYSIQNGVGNFYGVPVGSTSAASAVAITFSFASATTLASVPAVYYSNNATTAQFAVSTLTGLTTTCTANKAISAGGTCVLYVAFVPTQAGPVSGAVTLMSSTGTVLATVPLTGVGDAPVPAFAPGTQSTLLSSLGQPEGVTVDAGGNLYVADAVNKTVTKTTSAGVTSTLGFTGLNQPTGVAVDGVGSVYVSDAYNNAVYKLTTGGTQSTIATTGLKSPAGIALDSLGNLYIADSGNAHIVKVTAAGVQSTINFTGLTNPMWVAVDFIGEVAVSDTGKIYELSASGVQSTITATGLGTPAGIALSVNGSLYAADSTNGNIYVLPNSGVSGIASFGSSLTLASGLLSPTGIAISANGNLYVADATAQKVILLDRTKDTITFPPTASGATSASITARVQNVGNSTLTDTAFAVSSGYQQLTPVNATTDCSATSTVLPSALCNVNIQFVPTALGSIPGTVTLTDNALNASAATQAISLTGTGITATTTTLAQTTPATGNSVYGQAVTVTATVAPTSGSGTPTGNVTFTLDGTTGPTIALSSGAAAYSPTGLAAGTHTITANYSGDVNYAVSASSTFTLTIAQAVLTVTPVAQTRQYNVANAALTYNITGYAYTDTVSVVSGTPVLSTTATTTSDPGSYPISITLGTLTASNYSFNLVASTITVTHATNTITFPTIANVTYGAFPIPLTATTSSGLPITYSVLAGSSFASVTSGAGAAITILGAGTVTIAANQAGNTDYAAATQVTKSFVIAPATLTVTATNLSKQQGAANPTLTSSFSGFVYSDTASVVSGTPSITTTALTTSPVGTYPITITQGTLAAANYVFSFVNGTMTITGNTAQTITFGSLPAVTYGVAPLTLSATTTSGLAASYTISGPATLSGSTLTITGKGTVTVTASQAGNNTYAAATAVTESFVVNPAILTVVPVSTSINYGAAIPTFTYNITGFVNSDPTTVVSGAPSITTTAVLNSPVGSYPITATIGTLLATNYVFAYNSATLTINADPQTITFSTLPTVTYGVAPITLAATTTSGLTITYAATGPATISGSTLTITGAGSVTVTAAQAGNATTAAATSVLQTFTVSPAALTVTASNVSIAYGAAIPTTFAYTITGFVNSDTQTVVTGAPVITTNATSTSIGGTYNITPTVGTLTAANYTFPTANFVAGTLTITAVSQTITFAALPNIPQTTTSVTLSATASSGLPITYTVASTVATVSGNVITISGPGTVAVTATQPGNSSYSAATPVTQTFNVTGKTSTAFVLSANTAYQGVSVTLTATVTGTVTGAGAVPTGTVSFYSYTLSNTVLLSTVSLKAGTGSTATATLSSATLPAGNLSITAVYSGDVYNTTSTSSAQTLLIVAPDFNVTASATNFTVTAAQPGSTVITVTPVGGYAQTISFSCAPVPAAVPVNLTCTFTPAAMNFYPGTGVSTLAQTTTLTVTSGSATARMNEHRPFGNSKYGVAMAALFMGLFAVGLPFFTGTRKKGLRKRLSHLAVLLLAMGAFASLSGCSNSQTITGTTPTGTYDISVLFNDGTTVSHYLSLTVTVQ
jgi:sugar lactone lactonase YvrE